MEALIMSLIVIAIIAGFVIWEFYEKNKLIRSGDVYIFDTTGQQANEEKLARTLFKGTGNIEDWSLALNDQVEGIRNDGKASYKKYFFTYTIVGDRKTYKAQVILLKRFSN